MCPRFSTKAEITRPNVNNDWLMFPASRLRSPACAPCKKSNRIETRVSLDPNRHCLQPSKNTKEQDPKTGSVTSNIQHSHIKEKHQKTMDHSNNTQHNPKPVMLLVLSAVKVTPRIPPTCSINTLTYRATNTFRPGQIDQIQFPHFQQIFPFRRGLLHVDGDGEDGVGTAGLLVHLCRRHFAFGQGGVQMFVNVVRAFDQHVGQVLHHDASAGLGQFQRPPRVHVVQQEVFQLFVVQFHERDLDTGIRSDGPQTIENIFDRSWDDAFHVGFVEVPFHGVGFAGAGLAVPGGCGGGRGWGRYAYFTFFSLQFRSVQVFRFYCGFRCSGP